MKFLTAGAKLSELADVKLDRAPRTQATLKLRGLGGAACSRRLARSAVSSPLAQAGGQCY